MPETKSLDLGLDTEATDMFTTRVKLPQDIQILGDSQDYISKDSHDNRDAHLCHCKEHNGSQNLGFHLDRELISELEVNIGL